MERVIQQTELTTVFTREGKIVIPIDEEEKSSIKIISRVNELVITRS